jgi:hypothetical protein
MPFTPQPPKGYVSLTVAAAETGYSKEYLYRLARSGKIEAVKLGSLKKWFVNLVQLRLHKADMQGTWAGSWRRYTLKVHPSRESDVRKALNSAGITFELFKEN